MAKARDKFWIFGVRPGQDDTFLKVRYGSRMTPAEASYYLNAPNMIMVNCDGIPVPFSNHAHQYAISFKPCKKVLWGSTGSGGFRIGNEEAYICKLAEEFDNIYGAFMDDFFGRFKKDDGTYNTDAMITELKTIKDGLSKAKRKLELYTVWYVHEHGKIDPEVFKYIDGLTMWTWNSEELCELEERFEKMEKGFPKHKKLLGVYMYDFYNKIPVPLDRMEHQCEVGLRLMKQGRLDGLIFEANSVMGVDYPSEYWLREWANKVGDESVPD